MKYQPPTRKPKHIYHPLVVGCSTGQKLYYYIPKNRRYYGSIYDTTLPLPVCQVLAQKPEGGSLFYNNVTS